MYMPAVKRANNKAGPDRLALLYQPSLGITGPHQTWMEDVTCYRDTDHARGTFQPKGHFLPLQPYFAGCHEHSMIPNQK